MIFWYIIFMINGGRGSMAKSGKFLKEQEILRNMEEDACID